MCLPLVGTNFGPPQTRPHHLQLCIPLVCNMNPLFNAPCATYMICSPACFVHKCFCPPRFNAARSACSPSALEPLRQGLRFTDGPDHPWYAIGGMSIFQLAAVHFICRSGPSRFGPTRPHTPMGGSLDSCGRNVPERTNAVHGVQAKVRPVGPFQ